MEQQQDCKVIEKFNRKKNGKFMTPHELAAEYGIGINKAYQLVHVENFPKIMNGNRTLIIRSKVDEFFENSIGLEF